MELDYVSIGKRIRDVRKERGLTQTKLAEKACIEANTLSHIERAATKFSLISLISIANALEISLDELIYNNLVKNDHIRIKLVNELLSDCTTSEFQAIYEVMKATKNALRDYKF